jgi:predicted ATPase/serine phosphatase RsbU (regulator of sigma subunit)
MHHLARYALTDKIHESASAVFFRGYRQTDRVPVTVKCLKSEYPSLTELAKLRHEFAILRELDLEGVVRAFGLERYGNGLALVTEDIGGQPLDVVLRARRLPLRTTLELGVSLAKTLATVHGRRVIHKDVKPHNILVNLDTREVRLIDFGIATRLAQEATPAGAPGALEGTLAYMSPEQTGRMNRATDYRTDLYSLGVTLYEMLTGVLPFAGADPVDLVYSHIARRPTPPCEVDPAVPRVVSDIVMKLLSKAAEDRYQRAAGLAADLQRCLDGLDAAGQIEPFELGRRDAGDGLQIPQKLYGRDAELGALLAAFGRAADGAAELLLVTGYAGVGKSVLVHEIYRSIAQRRGHFVAGKFDQLSRSVPFAPVAYAFRDLIRQILAEPPEAFATWKERLQGALGNHGQVIIDLIPEVELLIGPQPEAQSLGPTEAQNRFTLAFQNFIRVFTRSEHPLVVFLDDLQWADPASLKLLQLLLTDPDSGHLLVIGAYRDNEVGPGHPLMLGLEELSAAGATLGAITVGPLEPAHVAQLVADAVGSESARVEPLAQVVFEKTRGNPFFVTQFLSALSQDGLLTFDAGAAAWVWDIDAIYGAAFADNVVDFLAAKIKRLPPETQQILALAACIGHRFDLQTLAAVRGRPAVKTAVQLWDALRDGVVLPLGTQYHWLDAEGGDGAAGDADDLLAGSGLNVSYRFLHDRAQQAAYGLIAEGQRAAVHLRIGRVLRGSAGRELRDDELFDVVNHLNLGAAHIADADERLELARLNLAAGRRAKVATAYEAAAGYFAAGMARLEGEAGWEGEYDLTFALHFERAECEYLVRRAETAEALFATLLARARTKLEKARIHDLHVNLLTTLGHIAQAQAVGAEALRLFGVELPATDDERRAAFAVELAEVARNLAGRKVADVVGAPPMADAEQLAVQTLVNGLFPSSFLTSPFLYAFVIVRHVNLSLKNGQSPMSAVGYVSYGYLVAGVLGRYEEARQFGELALALGERFKSVELTSKLYFLFGVFSHFFLPVRGALEHLARSRAAGLETGDFQYCSYTTYCTFMCRFGVGDDLAAVREEVDRFWALMQRTKDALSTGFLLICRQVVANLEGRTRGRLSLSDDAFDEDAHGAMLAETGQVFLRCFFDAYRAQIAFVRGDYARALALADAAEASIGSAAGLYFTTDLVFYLCLTLAALDATAPPEARARGAERLAAGRATLAGWASHCPSTYAHKALLVDAEAARLAGDETGAMALYDRAIEAARAAEFVRDEALANELCARFHLARGRTKIARAYMTDAYYGYVRWAAPTKLADLEAEFPHLTRQTFADGPRGGDERVAAPSWWSGATMTRSFGGHLIDAATVIEAAQAISSELVLDRVLERMMRLVIENAGAQRGFLLLERDGRLRVEAAITVDPDVVRVGLGRPVDEAAGELAVAVVRHVAATRAGVVMGDAGRNARFAADPYVVRARPRSIACLPMSHQGRLTGVLYLENNAANDAFTPARSELLQVLSAQAASAVENAMLYASVRESTEQLRRANETLERQVAERTEELRRANAELWSEMDVARKIQTVLLPRDATMAGYEVAAVMRPAADVGGDYYDVFRARDRDWVLVGDVSGHGVPAGLIMMMVQTAVRTAVLALQGEAPGELAPSRVLAVVNAAVRANLEKIGKGQYVTVTALCFDGPRVRYAGLHEDMLIYRAAEGRVECVETRGVWLGILDDIEPLLDDDELRLGRGDVLLLVTDGLAEARREGRMVGREALAAWFEAAVEGGAASSEAVVARLIERLAGHAVNDDVTVLAVRRRPADGGGA